METLLLLIHLLAVLFYVYLLVRTLYATRFKLPWPLDKNWDLIFIASTSLLMFILISLYMPQIYATIQSMQGRPVSP